MECLPLSITLLSASGLKDVNFMSKMDVYAVVSVSGDPRSQKQKTPVDKDGGTTPKWNYNMKLTIDAAAAKQNRLILEIKLKSDRALGDKDIGEVHVPIKELIDNIDASQGENRVTYSVRTPSGKAKGTLEFSYNFGDKFTAPAPEPMKAKKTGEPVVAYPPAHPGSSSAYPPPYGYGTAYPPPGVYPPPQHGYPPYPGAAYPPAPAPGYGYPPAYGPPPQAGYGYQVAPPQKPKKSGFGGAALGLGAGLLGGLVLGEMVEDAAEAAAFDGDFDF